MPPPGLLSALRTHATTRGTHPAVVDGDIVLTYHDLYARARTLATELRATGIGPGDAVGLCARRGAPAIVSMIGILLADAAFVPLDPSDPPERLGMTARGVGVGTVVSPERWHPAFLDLGLRCLTAPESAGPHTDGAEPGVAKPDDLAYVIHTSGTTGRPKGVGIRRSSLDHLCRNMGAAYGLAPEDRVLQFSSISFDSSVDEICTPLYAGATVVVRADDMISSPELFLRHCADLRISVALTTTAYWHELVDGMVADGLPLPGSVRLVRIGGEQVRADRIKDWRRLPIAPRVRLVDVYGPTETTVIVTYEDHAGPLAVESEQPTIGRALPGVLAEVVNADGEPAEDGELLIGGPTVAVGYVNQPELTTERFLTTAEGLRYYRTGDRVRRLPDGRFVCHGRMDRQIKVRGHRVETAEVEQALLDQPHVRDVVVRYDEARASLIGYLLLAGRDGDPRAAVEDVRRGVRRRLPAHAVPSLLVPVEVFPLTSRGKVDVAALAAFDAAFLAGADGEPADRLAALVAEVLDVPSLGSADSLFELGLHSLLATRLVTRIKREFGIRVALADVYANPTVTGLARLVGDAGPAPRTSEELHGGPRTDQDAFAGATRGLPLTAFQRDSWLAEQLQPGTPLDTLGVRYRISGPVTESDVAAALRRVIARHDALRALFDQGDDGPVMVFDTVPETPLTVHDLTGVPPGERPARARELADAHGRRALDPRTGPLLAALLIRLDAAEWELVVAVHHLVFDGWSASVLADELAALLGGGDVTDTGDFADHLRREAEAVREPSRAGLREHWAARLSGVDTEVELLLDRPRPPVRSFAGAKIERPLDPALLERVERAAHEAGTTTHTFVLAVLQTLLARLRGRHDITVLAPVAHRADPGIERAIGAFINVLPLRTDLSGDPDFATVLRRANATVLDALDHEELPLAEIMEAAGVRHRVDRSPISQVMLIVVNTPSASATHGGVTVERLGQTFPGLTKLDLTVTLDFPAGGPRLAVEYATDLFEEATAEALLEQFMTLLGGALDQPGAAYGRLPILPATQRRAVLSACVRPSPPVAEGGAPVAAGGVHELIEGHARRTPDAPAIFCEGRVVSYARLDEEAERLARLLHAAGVTPGDRVGIHLPRGPLVHAAVLAVWKVGAAFVPLDPDYPAERLHYMIDDSAATALLTGDGGAFTGAKVIGYDDPDPAGQRPAVVVGADDPAYVLYTSGTTGTPKGVVVSHGNLVHAVAMWQAAYGLREGWTHLQAASFSFDVFVGESLRALCTGGRLVVCPREVLLDPDALDGLLRGEQVAVAELVPTVLRGLLDHVEGAGRDLSMLRVLAGGADQWYVHEYRRARALVVPGGRVVNSYGVTEATVDNAYFEGDTDGLPPQAPLPIGGPYPGNRLYVLDPYGEPVPFGAVGELWIGGPGVATGYHERPELTAARFRPDPFSQEPGARMYRTGDGARLRADGLLDFLGRLDDQVKVNGHRIELAEVEAALSALPQVRAAAAAVRVDGRGRRLLVGYVDPAGAPVTPAQVRAGLQDMLPHHAIPARTVMMDALPVSPNGKVDRKSLPDAPEQDAGEKAELESETQRGLAEVWATVLPARDIGPDDGFFELGGDSFAALKLVRAIESWCGVRVSLLDLYRRPTVRQLAEHLDTLSSEPTGNLLHRLTPPLAGPAVGTLVCVPYSGGQAISFEPLAAHLPPGWSLYALQSPGRDWSRPDERPLPMAELVERCLEELRDLPGPLYIYGHCGHGSAVSVALATAAEQTGLPLRGVAIGAVFPTARLPGRVFDWIYRRFPLDRFVSDRRIVAQIRALGGGIPDFADEEEQALFMRAVRHDDRGAEEYFARTLTDERHPRLCAPLLSVVGEKDRVTELYEERYHEWEHYAEHVGVAVIPKAGHGFLKNQPDRLARILIDWAEQNQEQEPDAPPGAAPMPEPRKRVRPSLGRFGIVAAGQSVSMVGSALTQLVLTLWVYRQTGDIADFAYISAVALLPGILVGPLAGAVADRYDRRTVMLVTDVVTGLATAALALLSADGVSMVYVYLLCGITSLASAFQRPAYVAGVAQLVPKPFLGHANGISRLGVGAGTLLAPLLAAGLFGSVPLQGILLADAATFLVAAACLLLVRFPDQLFKRREEPMLTEIANGWRYITRRPGLTTALRQFVIDHVFYTAGFALFVPLIVIEHGVEVLGFVLSAGGLGALLGSLAMSVWGGTRRRTNGILVFMWVNRAGQVAIALSGEPWLIAVGMFVFFFAESVVDGHWLALVQTKVGLELQGRVLATYMTLMMVTMPLGYVIIGPLADRAFTPLLQPDGALAATLGPVLGTGPGRGLALVILVSAVILVGWTLYGWLNRRFRFLEDGLPDAVPGTEIEDRDTEQRRADERLVGSGV
ncbi:amino acid adenylation domain-containing protein [Nonomuraea sp. NPDC000554]|uniref:non-ribosomal peptide synthetase/MFS transporter n=1 Tax=Nonomuraea sp. NPDC000554 TaxID=3154259 RepID=UPI00332A8D58